MTGYGEFGETGALGDALGRLAGLLPPSWRLIVDPGEPLDSPGADAVVSIGGPTGAKASFVVAHRRSGSASTSTLLTVLRELQRASPMPVLFVSDYIGPVLREALSDRGFSFADGTGWIRVVSDDPLVVLTGLGAARAPHAPRTSAITRLNGLAASRTIRSLTTVDLPVGVRSLAALAGVSPGSVSKLLATLVAEGIVDRDSRGAVTRVRRRALLRRWVVDYSFAKTNRSVGYYIAPRGLDRTLERLEDVPGVAITGSAAARRLLPASSTSIVPMRLLAIYAARPADVVRGLRLIDADPGAANVVIARPQDAAILATSDTSSMLTAPTALVIADLLTLPGRSDAEAEQLMDALAAHEDLWRE